MTFDDGMTLADARDELRELIAHGHRCPLCTQFAKVYRRKLPSTTARVIIALYRAGAVDDVYVFLPDLLERTGDVRTALAGGYATLAQFWGLIERRPGERDDGSDHVGWWRVTELGAQFVRLELSVPSHVRLYDGRCLGFDGDPVTIRDALGHRFNYDELMSDE